MSDLLLMTGPFLWLGLLCGGGGLGVIPGMQGQVVATQQGAPAGEFVDGYTLAQLAPGPTMLVVAFVGYRAHGLLGAGLATVAMFLPSSLIVVLVAAQWQRLRAHRWAASAERALLPIGIGLSTAGVYTLARSALHDLTTIVLAVGGRPGLSPRPAPALPIPSPPGLARVLPSGV